MDDYMMYEYLKKKGMNEEDFMYKFKEFMDKYRRNSIEEPINRYKEDIFRKPFREYEDLDMIERYRRNSIVKEHFDESEAKYIVSKMYHTEDGRKYSGEKFDMFKAKEICERYRGLIPNTVTTYDLYIAINSQYHDYAELFKAWFGSDIDQKIIESAIVFWFKDVDCKVENKVVEYFK